MSFVRPVCTGLCVALAASALPAQAVPTDADATLWRRECAFADTLARRDLAGFAGFVSEQALFHNGPAPLRGRAAVQAYWKRYFDAPAAPFSWYPDTAELLEPDRLAHTSGPVFDPDGRLIARFHTIWRKEPDGMWRVLLDHGGAPDAKDAQRHPRPDPLACR